MKKNLFRSLLFLVVLIVSINAVNQKQETVSAESLISQFIERVDNTKTLKISIIIKERIKKEYNTRKASFKVQNSPFKLYMKEEYPVKGREVLYVTGQNENKALINPAAFPWTDLSLNPIGNMMRSGNHHSIFKSGYFFINQVLKHMKAKFNTDLDQLLKYNGMVNYGDVLCYKITFDNPTFGYTTYKTLPNETMEDISGKLLVDDYMILEKNPQLKDVESIKPGMILKVPTDYGRSFTLYFSKENSYLVGIRVYDETGLWEEYSYSNIVLNPTFTALDFSKDNPDYGF